MLGHIICVYFLYLLNNVLVKHFELFIGALYLPAFVQQLQVVSYFRVDIFL